MRLVILSKWTDSFLPLRLRTNMVDDMVEDQQLLQHESCEVSLCWREGVLRKFAAKREPREGALSIRFCGRDKTNK